MARLPSGRPGGRPACRRPVVGRRPAAARRPDPHDDRRNRRVRVLRRIHHPAVDGPGIRALRRPVRRHGPPALGAVGQRADRPAGGGADRRRQLRHDPRRQRRGADLLRAVDPEAQRPRPGDEHRRARHRQRAGLARERPDHLHHGAGHGRDPDSSAGTPCAAAAVRQHPRRAVVGGRDPDDHRLWRRRASHGRRQDDRLGGHGERHPGAGADDRYPGDRLRRGGAAARVSARLGSGDARAAVHRSSAPSPCRRS